MFERILDFVESKVEGFNRPGLVISIFDHMEFGYYKDKLTVMVPNNLKDVSIGETKKWWNEFMKSYIFDNFNMDLGYDDCIVFTFLHEIGHHITMKDLTYEEMERKYNKELDELLRKCKDDIDLEIGYRKISFEQMADEWAIDFISKYPEVLSIIDVSLV